MELINSPELCNVILVSLSHSKAPVSVKRSQSVRLHITHEKLLKQNLVVFTHICTEKHFKQFSIITSNLRRREMLQQLVGWSMIFGLVSSQLFLLVPELAAPENCWG